MDYSKAATIVKYTIAKGGEPLTEGQGILMAGAIAVLLEQAKAEQRESDAKICETPINIDGTNIVATRFAKAIRNNKE